MKNTNGKIRVIKRGELQTSNVETKKAIQVNHTETRRGAGEIVSGWISEYRQNKRIEREVAAAFWQTV